MRKPDLFLEALVAVRSATELLFEVVNTTIKPEAMMKRHLRPRPTEAGICLPHSRQASCWLFSSPILDDHAHDDAVLTLAVVTQVALSSIRFMQHRGAGWVIIVFDFALASIF